MSNPFPTCPTCPTARTSLLMAMAGEEVAPCAVHAPDAHAEHQRRRELAEARKDAARDLDHARRRVVRVQSTAAPAAGVKHLFVAALREHAESAGTSAGHLPLNAPVSAFPALRDLTTTDDGPTAA